MLMKAVFLFACLFSRSYSAPHLQSQSMAAGVLHELSQLSTQLASHDEVASDDRTSQQATYEEDELSEQDDSETDQRPTAAIIMPTTPSDRIIDLADSELPPDAAVGHGIRDRICINTYEFQTLADILKEVVDDVATSVTSQAAIRHIVNLADLSVSMNRNTIGSRHCMNTYDFQAFVNELRELLDTVNAPGIVSAIENSTITAAGQ